MEKEIFGLRLATLHNLAFYGSMMEQIREAVESKQLRTFATAFLAKMEENDD